MKKTIHFLMLTNRLSKSYIPLLLATTLLSSGQILFNVYVPKILLEALVTKQPFYNIILLAFILIILNHLLSVTVQYLTNLKQTTEEVIAKKINQVISEKIQCVEYRYLEDPHYLDLKESAVYAFNNQGTIWRLLNGITEVLKNVISIIGVSVILLSLGYPLFIVLLLGTIISGLIIIRGEKNRTTFYKNNIPINRELNYYLDTMTNNHPMGKDFRLYQGTDLIFNQFCKANQRIIQSMKKIYSSMNLNESSLQVITAFENIFIYGYITYKTLSQHLSVSMFTLYANSAIQFSQSLVKIITECSSYQQALRFYEPFIEFMAIENEASQGKDIKPETSEILSIRFEHVSFQYPHQDKEILSDIDFEIKKHEKISIVGLNGAGKTTLIKLLCRFYKPTSGHIYMNGIDIWDIEKKSYYQMLGCVFQDFKLFAYSIKDNIKPECQDDLSSLLKMVGLNVNQNVLLGKELDQDATELSGGQNQKLAIARAMYKNSPIMILDEPTSALDPISENQIYELFNTMIKNKIGIYISHRMSSSQFCDKILVLENGHTVDYDTHEHLMQNKEGLYYRLFTSQASHYAV